MSSAVKGAPSDQRTVAQLQRYAVGVSGELVALRHVGNDLSVGGHLQDPRRADHGFLHQVVPRHVVEGINVELATIAADRLHRFHHLRLFRQPLVDRWQLAPGYHLRQHGSFLVLAGGDRHRLFVGLFFSG
jgi:hypothetical protein